MILVGKVGIWKSQLVKLVATQESCQLLTLVFLWGLGASQWQFGMRQKRGFARGYCYGRRNTYQKGEDSRCLVLLLLVYQSILCCSFTIPRIVRMRLEKIQRDFLWGGEALENKLLLVKWSIVCKAKSKGGLGVCSLSLLNKALLCKWCWLYSSEGDSLRKNIVRGKLGDEEGGQRSDVERDSYGIGGWKMIGQQWDFFNLWFLLQWVVEVG